jgi:hypothetical protein
MEALRTIGHDALGTFRAVLAFPDVTGLLVETDPLLKRLWRIRTSMPAADWLAYDELLARYPSPPLWPGAPYWSGPLSADASAAHRPPPCDPYWRCQSFDANRQGPWRRPVEGPGVVFTVLYDPTHSRTWRGLPVKSPGSYGWPRAPSQGPRSEPEELIAHLSVASRWGRH